MRMKPFRVSGRESFNLLVRCECQYKASPLPPAPLAIAGFLVAGLVVWQYSDRLGYCWLVGLLLLGVCFAGSVYCNVHKVLDASFHVICLALAVASLLVSLQLLTTAHCDRFDACCVGVFSFAGFCFIKFLS